MAEPLPMPLRLRRPDGETAAGIEQLLRQVPCPFVGPLRFAVWQATRAAGADARTADASRLVLADQLRADLAVAVELPELAGARPDQLLTGLIELARCLGAVLPAGRPFIDEAGWWMRAAGSDWFVTVHADCYPVRHSRHWARAGAVIVLMPRLAFDRGFPAGVPDSTRQAIRLAFARKGIGYPTGGGAVAER